MPLKMTVTLDQAAIRSLGLPGGVVDQAVAKAAGKVRDRAKVNLTKAHRVDKGALRQSIDVEPPTGGSPNEVVYRVGSPLPYAIYNERGTGLYGPHHSPIYPRRARVLRFKPGKNSKIPQSRLSKKGFVFTPSVKGMEGTRFLERALYSLTVDDFT